MLLLAPASCRDSTGPDNTAHVTVSVASVSLPELGSVADDGTTPLISCTVRLYAVADGPQDITWHDATFYWYAGKDRTTPLDSEPVGPGEIANSWGTERLASHQTQNSGWRFTAGVPFGVAIDYRYQAASGRGREQHARVDFTCGPAVPDDAPPPTIDALAVTPATGTIESGDTVTVDYTVSSALGLWQTALTLSGPCVVSYQAGEQLHATATRSVKLVLPGRCRVGEQLQVNLLVVDAARQPTFRSLAPPLTLVDERPPSVMVYSYPTDGGGLTDQVAGDYFGGDSIPLVFYARDNNALAAVVWEVTPYGDRDSLLMGPDAAFSPTRYVPVRPTWDGPVQIRVFARDAQGLVSDTVTSAAGALRVHPTVERPAMVASVNGGVNAVTFDLRRNVAYLLQGNSNQIAVLSLATMQVTTTIPLGGYPSDADLTAGGDSLLFTMWGQAALGVVDLTRQPLMATFLPLPGLDASLSQHPRAVRVASNGKAFVALEGWSASAYTLLELELRTGAQRIRTDAGNGGYVGPLLLETSLDRSSVVMNGGTGLFQRYDAATDSFGPRGSPAVSDWPPSVDGTGQHTAIGLDVYDASMQHIRRVHSSSDFGVPYTALSADGEYVYRVDGRYGIVRSRVSDGAIVDRTPNPIEPGLIRVSPDGATIVTAEPTWTSGPTWKISKIDMR